MNSDEFLRNVEAALDESVDVPNATIASASFERLLAVDRTDLPPAHFVAMRDGMPLAVRVYPASSACRLVVVHGAGGHSAHVHALARAVSESGLASVAVPDLRGNGLSGRRRSDAVTYPEQLRDDLLDLIASLRQDDVRSRIVLAGHSAGGGLVVRLAAEVPEAELAGVALLAPLLGGGPPTSRPQLGGWVSLYGRRVRGLSSLQGQHCRALNALTVMEFNQPPVTRDGRETLAWSYTTMRAFGPGRWRDALSAMRAPCFVLIGEADECFVASAYPEAVKAAAPAARVDILPECGHWDLLADSRAAAWLQDIVRRL